MQKKENNQTQAAMEFQSIVRNNIRMILARFPQKQESFALSLQLSQASISKKLNGKADWTSADIANAAEYFNLPFYVLVSPTALRITSSPIRRRNISCRIMRQLIFPVVSLPPHPASVTCVSRTRMREGHMAQSDRARSSCR